MHNTVIKSCAEDELQHQNIQLFAPERSKNKNQRETQQKAGPCHAGVVILFIHLSDINLFRHCFTRIFCSRLERDPEKFLSTLLTSDRNQHKPNTVEINRWHAKSHWGWIAASCQQAQPASRSWFSCTEVFSICAAGTWWPKVRQHPEILFIAWGLSHTSS